VNTKVLDTGERLFTEGGYLQFIDPPETLFGYTYFSAMIPPTNPNKVLILGYGRGTIAALIRKIWMNVEIFGVDIESAVHFSDDTFLCADAYDYVMNCKDKFGYIIIDLYNSNKVCDFIFDEKFVYHLTRICDGRLSLNLFDKDLEKNKWYHRYFKHEMTKEIFKNRVLFFKKKI